MWRHKLRDVHTRRKDLQLRRARFSIAPAVRRNTKSTSLSRAAATLVWTMESTLVLSGLDEVVRAAVREAVREALAEQHPAGTAGFLNLKNAAAFLDVTEEALRARVKRREIPVHRRDGRLYFDPHELRSYVEGVDCLAAP